MTSVVTLVAQNQVKDNQASASNSTDHRERCKAIGRRISCQWWQHHPWTLQGIYRLDCASHIAPKRTVNRVKEDECVRVCVWGTKLSIWKFVAKNWKLSSCMNSYVCTSPAKMKPNKPAQKDTNPPKLQTKATDSKTHFVNIHKQDNHFRLAEGFLT